MTYVHPAASDSAEQELHKINTLESERTGGQNMASRFFFAIVFLSLESIPAVVRSAKPNQIRVYTNHGLSQ